jgi:hypothetical protein
MLLNSTAEDSRIVNSELAGVGNCFVDKVSIGTRDGMCWVASRNILSEKGGLPYSVVYACFLKDQSF